MRTHRKATTSCGSGRVFCAFLWPVTQFHDRSGSFITRAAKDRDNGRMVERLSNQVEKEQRDQRILRVVIAQGPIGISRLSEETDVPEHKVRYSLRMLENDGLVEPTPNGAVPADDIADRVAALNRGIDDIVERLEAIKEIF